MKVLNIIDQEDGGAIIEMEVDKDERDQLISWALQQLLIRMAQEAMAGVDPK